MGFSTCAETTKRISVLLNALEPPYRIFPSETARRARALHALEWIGTEKAKAVLLELAAGPPFSRMTREAKAALGRLEGRRAK